MMAESNENDTGEKLGEQKNAKPKWKSATVSESYQVEQENVQAQKGEWKKADTTKQADEKGQQYISNQRQTPEQKEDKLKKEFASLLGKKNTNELSFNEARLAHDLSIGHHPDVPKRVNNLLHDNHKQLYKGDRVNELVGLVENNLPQKEEHQAGRENQFSLEKTKKDLGDHKDYHNKQAKAEQEKTKDKIPESVRQAASSIGSKLSEFKSGAKGKISPPKAQSKNQNKSRGR